MVIEDFKESIRAARRTDMKCLAATDSNPAVPLADFVAVVKALKEVELNYLFPLATYRELQTWFKNVPEEGNLTVKVCHHL